MSGMDICYKLVEDHMHWLQLLGLGRVSKGGTILKGRRRARAASGWEKLSCGCKNISATESSCFIAMTKPKKCTKSNRIHILILTVDHLNN